MTLEESKILAVAAINLVSNDTNNSEQIKICQIKSDTKRFEIIDKNQITDLLRSATEKYPNKEKQSPQFYNYETTLAIEFINCDTRFITTR